VSYPKKPGRKSRALRSLVVEGRTFRWRFRARVEDSRLTLYGEVSSGQPLRVILPEWRDPWLHICGFHIDAENRLHLATAARNEPAIITPSFARLAVLHGLANGWTPHERGPRLFCFYREGRFSELSQGCETLTAHVAAPVRSTGEQYGPS
jgi:hypothetical protein